VAERILTQEMGKRGDHDLWALYGLTMLQVSASELSRLFGAREQSIQAAYNRVRGRLQEALPNYAPLGATTPVTNRGREALPRQDVTAIRKANGAVPEAVYDAVKTLIEVTNADTHRADELALEGIRLGIPAQTQAQAHGLPTSRMQRAYTRVHLMIGAQRDPNIRIRRPECRVKPVFTLTAETTTAVQQLALDLLEQPKSYAKLVALYVHISNLAISTTAKQFNIPTSTLRYYAQQIGQQLGTPTKPARDSIAVLARADVPVGGT
jgi:DNA-directed RNA polymerase specialized sigma24 family protein